MKELRYHGAGWSTVWMLRPVRVVTGVGIKRKTEPGAQVFKNKGVFRWSVDNHNKEKENLSVL